MSFLRRLMGKAEPGDAQAPADPSNAAGRDAPRTTTPEQDEAERERELMRAEAHRLDDDLIQRQMRYADRSWTPPAQGGTRRADDEGAPEEP